MSRGNVLSTTPTSSKSYTALNVNASENCGSAKLTFRNPGSLRPFPSIGSPSSMRKKLGLCGRQKRRYRPRTTDSAHDEPIAPHRLAELPAASRRDQLWASDITYVQTEEGWLYLAVIMDLYSRRIVGWAFAHHLGTELVAAALTMALVHRRPPQGLIHHSDRGVQYASARLSELAQGSARNCQLESQRLLLRQCPDGSLFQYAES